MRDTNHHGPRADLLDQQVYLRIPGQVTDHFHDGRTDFRADQPLVQLLHLRDAVPTVPAEISTETTL